MLLWSFACVERHSRPAPVQTFGSSFEVYPPSPLGIATIMTSTNDHTSPVDLTRDLSSEPELSDAERQGYASGTESMPGSKGAAHDVEADVPAGGNPATTMDEA